MPGNAVVGKFVVGDGTLVGQTALNATVVVGKPKLVLAGKAFVTQVYADFHQLPMAKSRLVLKGKQTTHAGSSSPVIGKPRLVLTGKQFASVIPVQVYPGKSSLVLRGKSYVLGISAIQSVGKSKLILRGKTFQAEEVALLPTTPVNVDLTPSVPQTLDLVAAMVQTVDLVPTVVEVR